VGTLRQRITPAGGDRVTETLGAGWALNAPPEDQGRHGTLGRVIEIVGGTEAACRVDAAQDPTDAPDDAALVDILRRARTVAMVGASPNWNRPSYFVMKYLQRKGYRVIPVNPVAVGKEILGEPVVAALRDIPDKVDIVDVFRRADAVPAITDETIELGIPVLWLQLGVRHPESVARARAAGLTVIQDRCMKIEYGRLSGELAWSGVNGDVISSRRRPLIG
jgi:predicted CoA-binding protein